MTEPGTPGRAPRFTGERRPATDAEARALASAVRLRILRLCLDQALTNKEIAARLVISRKTVANHVEHIYAKIGASTRTAAALFATRHGLLTPTASPPGFARAPR